MDADEIASLCYERFQQLPRTGKPEAGREWTLLAAVVQVTRSARSDAAVKEVVSLGTGSKCIGQTAMSPTGEVLNDSHAEVLAKRGCVRYLTEELLRAVSGRGSRVWERVPETHEALFRLQPRVSFLLFTSHTPCGDASIIPKTQSQLLPCPAVSSSKRKAPEATESPGNKLPRMTESERGQGGTCDPHRTESERGQGGTSNPRRTESESGRGGTSDPHRTESESGQGGTSDPHRTESESGQGGTSDPHRTESESGRGVTCDPHRTESESGRGGTSDPHRTESESGRGGTCDPDRTESESGQGGTSDPHRTESGSGRGGTSDPHRTESGSGRGGTCDPDRTESESGQGGTSDPHRTESESGQGGASDPHGTANEFEQEYVADVHRTGAKCVPGGPTDPLLPGTGYHCPGLLRVKPGRGDRTLSLSCSDKLARWGVLGFQGALLSHYLQGAVYFTAVVVGQCPYSQEALHRALFLRCSHVSGLPPGFSLTSPLVLQSSLEFPFSQAQTELLHQAGRGRVSPCGAAISWCQSPEPTLDVTANGYKHGVTKKTLGTARARSLLCKRSLFESFLSVVAATPPSELPRSLRAPELSTYWDYKAASAQYQQAWARLRSQAFPLWPRSDRSLLLFTAAAPSL